MEEERIFYARRRETADGDEVTLPRGRSAAGRDDASTERLGQSSPAGVEVEELDDLNL